MSLLLESSPRDTSLQDSLTDTLSVVDAALATVARRIPFHVSREDLASAGKVALVEALLRFDGPPEEARAYCFVRVRGAVLDELRRLDPLSRHARAKLNLVRRAAASLERELGRAPQAAELSEATGFSRAALAELERLATAAQPALGNGSDGADGDGGFADEISSLVDVDAACPARSAEFGDAQASIRAALTRLPANHAHVIRRYYLEDATLDAIAAELGISKERTRQLREAAEKKLRADFVVLALWQSVFNHR